MQRDYAVGEVARSVGYEDAFTFTTMLKKRYGVSPSQYKQATLPGLDKRGLNGGNPG